MTGAGIVLLIFGLGSIYIGKSMQGSRSDIMALAELPFFVAGGLLSIIGGSMILLGGGQ